MFLDKTTGEWKFQRWCLVSVTLPTAALVAGGLTAGASVYSGITAAGAAKSAAKTQADAATLAASKLQPFIDAGTGSLKEEQNLLGLTGPGGTVPAGGPDQAAINATLQATPGYAFTKQQGLESVQNSYAAQGLGTSGAALKGAAQFATGLADQTYETRLQDYLKLPGQALEAQGQANQLTTSGAAATAAGIVGSTNALNSGISSAAGGIGQGLTLASIAPFLTQNQSSNPLSLGNGKPGNDNNVANGVTGTALAPTA